MSSCATWFDGVLLRLAVASTVLLSLSGCSQEKAGHGMVDAPDANEQDIDSRGDAAKAMLAGRLTSQCQRSAFTVWSDDIFVRQGVESNFLMPCSVSRW